MTQPNYYSVLGIPTHASADEIKTAYRKLIRQYHPDKNKQHDSERVRLINTAYQTLKDPKTKATYDRKLALETVTQTKFFKTADFVVNNTDFLAKQLAKNWRQTRHKLKASFQKNFDKKTNPYDESIELKLMPWQIALGETVLITTTRQTLRLNLPTHANHGTILRIAGAGKSIDGKTGDLYLKIIIENLDCQRLTTEQKQAFLALKQAFLNK